MLNKQGKLDVKIFFHNVNITIVVLGYFILNYPVQLLYFIFSPILVPVV